MSEEVLISYLADDIVYEWEREGRRLNFPRGADREFPDDEGDYPADVWALAVKQWDAYTPAEQQQFREYQEYHADVGLDDAVREFKSMAFQESFTYFDILWFALAVITAFRLGMTNAAED